MYVENLVSKNVVIEEFFRDNLEKFQATEGSYAYSFEKYNEDNWSLNIRYFRNGKPTTICLLDDRIIPFLSEELERAWIQYLYVSFGEEYKKWYLKKKKEIFE